MLQRQLILYLSEIILGIKKPHPVRIGIDGFDASGKTTLADEVAKYLQTIGKNVIRASIDGFHNLKSIRYKHGRTSPEGYYQDSFNYESLIAELLAPLGQNGDLRYKYEIFDFRNDCEIKSQVLKASKDSILIFDGVFLLRPELIFHWDLKIFLESELDVMITRARQRDRHLGTENEITEKYLHRYFPGQLLYIEEARPQEHADIIIDNNDFHNPIITKPVFKNEGF